MWECIWACGLQERALDRETGHRGPRTCTALAGIREQGKTGPAQLVKAVIFLSQQSSLSASHDPGNHSCVPNAETSFPENNFLLHVTALEDIKPGEVRGQVAVGVGGQEAWQVLPRNQQQQWLQPWVQAVGLNPHILQDLRLACECALTPTSLQKITPESLSSV